MSAAIKPIKAQQQQRLSPRLDFRPSDGLKAKLSFSELKNFPIQVYDISPTGACLILSKEFKIHLRAFRSVKVIFEIPDQGDISADATIKWIHDHQIDSLKFGVEFNWKKSLELDNESVSNIKIPEFTPIVGAIYKPYLFFERVPAMLLSISSTSWKIRIFDSEILAISGINYELFLNTTTVSQLPIKVNVLGIESIDKGSIVISAFPINIPLEISEWIAQQLIFGTECTPSQLRDLGFKIKNLANGLKFRYVKTQEEYESVLKLRFKAYAQAGKVAANKNFNDMSAPLDPISRIIAVYHGEKIVGSVAISFPKNESTILDTERAFENGYPIKVPPKQTMVEVSRLCTDPDYRQGDLMIRILEHIYKALRCGNRETVITSSDDKLWPLYKSLGFRKTGMSYNHPYLAGIKHHVIIQHAPQADSASKINPLAWNYAWRDMSSHLVENGTIHRTEWTKLKIRVLEIVGKILKINLKKKY